MAIGWSNAHWRMWSRPVDRYRVYFQGLLYQATITWHKTEEFDYHGNVTVSWHKKKRYRLVGGRTAYRRLPHHEKRDLTPEEEQRREWRRRESDKRCRRNCFVPRGPGRWVKKQTTSHNRSWAKYCLLHDRDEDIHPRYGKFKYGYWD